LLIITDFLCDLCVSVWGHQKISHRAAKFFCDLCTAYLQKNSAYRKSMRQLTEKTQIRSLLHAIVWDYDIDPYELFEVALGKKEQAGSFTREKALIWICL